MAMPGRPQKIHIFYDSNPKYTCRGPQASPSLHSFSLMGGKR